MIDKKPLWWNILLVVLATLYLIPEAIFNSQLVTLSGKGTPTKEDLENLELFGRTISGIGVTLLFADLLKSKLLTSKIKALFSLFCLFLLVWPIVFYGQKYLVERFIIESSTGAERQTALISAALRDALAYNIIKINDIDYNKEDMSKPENLTFISLFGGLIYVDNTLSERIEDQKANIIRSFISQKVYNDFEKHYSDYSKLYEELSTNYKDYAVGSNKYNEVILNIPNKEIEYWSDIETEVNIGFQKYKEAQKAHVAKASARAQEYGGRIVKYFENESRCFERYKGSSNNQKRYNCVENLKKDYRIMIQKAGLGYIETDYWLIVEDVSGVENATNTIISGILTGGVYTGLQALDKMLGGDGGIKDKRYKYTTNPEHYTSRFLLHPKFVEMFQKDTGYSFFIESLNDFRIDKETQVRLIKKLRIKGIDLNSNWNITKKAEFSIAVDKLIRKEAMKEWNMQTSSKGFKSLKPNLDWDSFQLHKEIQLRIKSKMDDLYVDNIKADWNKKNFKLYVVDPNIEKKTQKYLDIINSTESEFENGGLFEQEGKQALRSVIIPPISMFLSLFLICLTLSKLPSKYYNLIMYKKEGKNKSKVIKVLSKLYMPVLILIIPILIIKNDYTKDPNSTVNHFLEKIDQDANPVFAYALRWTLHTQPILHPLGNSLENVSGIYKIFSNYNYFFHNIDINMESNKSNEDDLSLNETKDKMVSSYNNTIKTGTLFINAPKGSRIRIMNIKPSYSENMNLDVGDYDIEVTLPDGNIIRKWYRLKEGKNTFNI